MSDSKLDAALSKLAANKAAALSGALALAMGIVVGVTIAKDDPQRDAKLEQLGEAIDNGSASTREPSQIDSAAYHEAIIKVRNEDPSLVDLLSPIVDPGTEVVTGANFPTGARLVGDVELVGVAAKAFVVLEATCTDAAPVAKDAEQQPTWCEVRARNDGPSAQRLTALVHFEAPTP